MTSKNKKVYDRLNITKWHDMGYTGKDVKVAIIGFEKGAHHNGASIIKEIAPGCETTEINVMKGGVSFESAFQQCLDIGADVVCCSLRKSSWSSELERLSKALRDGGCIMIDSADNEGEEIDAYPALDPSWIAIGAYDQFIDGKASYSCYGEKMLGLCYTGLDSITKSGTMVPLTHTSGAVQIPSGMAALLKEHNDMTPEGFERMVKRCAIDLKEEGKDIKTGWGLIYMPGSIEDAFETEIKLVIGLDIAKVNGETVRLDSPAKIENDRTMVPLRFIAEVLGCEVSWDGENRVVTIKK